MTFEFTDPVDVMADFVSDALKERDIDLEPSELKPVMAALQERLHEVKQVDRLYYQDWLKNQPAGDDDPIF